MIFSNVSEKEIAIFNGLIELIKQGCNPYSIKVSDIAKASNVGKGTIYDYFDSKEEAISKALLFNICKEIEISVSRIESRPNFIDKYNEVLAIIEENIDNNLSIYNLLFSYSSMDKVYEYLVDEKIHLKNCMLTIEDMIDHILEVGFEEGILINNGDKYYQRMVLRSSIGSFTLYLNHRKMYDGVSVGEAKKLAYKLLTKALN